MCIKYPDTEIHETSMNVRLYMRFVAVFVENVIIQPTKGSKLQFRQKRLQEGAAYLVLISIGTEYLT